MNFSETRWKEFETLRKSLFRIQQPGIQLKIYVGKNPVVADCRGIISQSIGAPNYAECVESKRSIIESQQLSPTRLCVDDYVSFEFVSSKTGYLHLINLGTGGKVSIVFPNKNEQPPLIRRDVPTYYTSNNPHNLLTEDPEKAVSDIQEQGPIITGAREQFLAIVTNDSEKLIIASLNPGWMKDQDLSDERSVPWASMTVKSASFLDRPIDTWDWGWIDYEI